MRRRDLLKMTALAPCVPLMLGGCAAFTTNTETTSRRRVRPADESWPSKESWGRLNAAVGGNLLPVQPLFALCAPASGSAGCADVLEHLRNPFYLGDQPAGTQVSGWLDAWTPAPSVYAIKARTTADVVAGVNFARLNNLRLVVKGTGHSYLGTSNAADSLLIWTRAMNRVQVHDAFTPMGCSDAPAPAVTAEPGAVSIDLYYAVTTGAGRYVQGGGCTDTGVAGLIQSGGFGSFSKGYGTVASNLLEAEVVTADGSVLTANACLNPDLFWALKGGGGGTFGVITRATLQTHELPKSFGGASASIKAQSDAAFQRLIARFLTFYQESLLNPHWGEQIKFGPGNTLEISLISQGIELDQMYPVWKPFMDWMKASAQDYSVMEPRAFTVPARTFWDVENNPAMIHDTRPGSPKQHCWWRGDQDQVGAFLHGYESLWLPASLLETSAQPRLAQALFAASRFKRVELHMNKGLAGATPAVLAAARQTAINPAVLDAFALVIIADGEGAAYPGMPRPALNLGTAHTDAHAIDRAAAPLRKLVPDAGSYVSESNYFNPSWQRAYWGDNYARLRAIKKRYDPHGLFFVHHGVGSEEWSPDGFTRL
ncbi:MAG TPA: FAD-binding oxidoreductase [Steroidobacteraceae bacterium]|nr:FAD-binding oxidoreductase [Steroidobacteraceae bacterium]